MPKSSAVGRVLSSEIKYLFRVKACRAFCDQRDVDPPLGVLPKAISGTQIPQTHFIFKSAESSHRFPVMYCTSSHRSTGILFRYYLSLVGATRLKEMNLVSHVKLLVSEFPRTEDVFSFRDVLHVFTTESRGSLQRFHPYLNKTSVLRDSRSKSIHNSLHPSSKSLVLGLTLGESINTQPTSSLHGGARLVDQRSVNLPAKRTRPITGKAGA